jgi:adenylate cyclase
MGERVELWRRTVRRLTWAAVAANGLGGLALFLLLGFLLPFAPDGPDRQLALNAVVGAVYLSSSLVVGTWFARRRAATVERWLASGRAPTEEERRLVLAQPFRFVAISAVCWSVAAVLFTLLNVPSSGWAALVIGGAMLLAAETTLAVGYLMVERILRPVTIQALAGAPPPETCGRLGVAARLGMAWSLGTGIPLIGILTMTIAGLHAPDEDPTLLAAAIAFLAVLGIGVGSFAISVAARSVAEPIAAVRRAMTRVEEGEFGVRVPVDDSSEVGLLEAGFNSMASGLEERERIRDLFGRHVGREVAKAALERDGEVELGGELRETAIVFVDVVDSTGLAIRRPPHEVVALLNSFFALVVEVVEKHGGWVNKFEGDAALCVFGAPTARPDAAGDALRAARELRERLAGELHGATRASAYRRAPRWPATSAPRSASSTR